MNVYIIRSYKPASNPVLDGQLTQCDPKDPDESYFTIIYHGSCELGFDSFHEASRVVNALNYAFQVGRRQAFSDLRNFIGVE